MMINVTHPEMVAMLAKKPEAILPTLDLDKVDLIHAVMGIVGEAGELLDGIKKHVIYDKELHLTNVVEELGDIEFYIEQLRQRLGITREQTLDSNIVKLKKRYDGLQYSDKAAHDRADKVIERNYIGKPPIVPHTSDMQDLVDAERKA
jgi:NTP pyrophosphatase (non-canonical NTP hydrolase)